jgi:DNA-binding MarR family transcriptional regulator
LSKKTELPIGTQALIFSKYYYGVLSKRLEGIEVERYFSILYFLQENSGCTQQFICNNLAIDKTAMVKVVDYLLKMGYVIRKSNPEDRREQFVFLSAKGKKRTGEIVDGFKTLDKQLFDGINKKNKEIFQDVLRQLTGILRDQPSNDLFFNYSRTKKSRIK